MRAGKLLARPTEREQGGLVDDERRHVRPAGVEDLDDLQEVYRRASLSNEEDRPFLLERTELLRLDPTGVQEGRTFVALDGEHVIGFATYSIQPEHVELEALFVDPEHHRRGHAQRLLEAVVDAARRSGVTRIEVTANDHALDFYQAAGFVTVGTVETQLRPAPRMHLAIPTSTADR